MSDKLRVMIQAPFADFSGYATVARNFILGLHKLDVFDLYLEPIVWINSGNLELSAEDKTILDNLLQKSQSLTIDDAREMTLVHFTIATEFVGKRNSPFKRNIGFTMLETDRVTPTWAAKCNQMDAVIVPSVFCLSSFMQSGIVSPIRIVPFGVDFDAYNPVGEKLLSNLPTKFNFLTVGQWLPNGDRKNITGSIRAFLTAFRGNKDVGLIVKTYHESAGTRDKLAVTSSIESIRESMGFSADDAPNIYLVHGSLPESGMAQLYRSADAFVLPTTGEAWGMPLLEAAATGLPIITTSGTGAEAFLNEEHTVLLNYEWTQLGGIANWPGVYEPYQQLAVPDMDECARMMLRMYKNQELTKEQANKQREEIISRDFSWKSASQQFADTIKEIVEDLDAQ